ncbi:hypothetical protein Dimus_017190 [Dionaea muscipula]
MLHCTALLYSINGCHASLKLYTSPAPPAQDEDYITTGLLLVTRPAGQIMRKPKTFDIHNLRSTILLLLLLVHHHLVVIVLLLPPPRCLGLSTDGVLLLSLKYSIISDPLSVLANWNYYDDTPCSWNGITCGGSGVEVTGISLPNSQLLGSIPSDLALIHHLLILDLSNNSINGSIPDSLFNVTGLRVLDLSNNWLSGELPDLIAGLTGIQSLNLSDNALAGNLPGNLTALPNLIDISLRNNYFSGGLPGGWFHRVRFLDLSSNLINGSLPPGFGGDRVEYFNVSYNKLSGKIPAQFGQKIPANATLDFSYNKLTGEVPDSPVFLNQQRDSFSGNPGLCGEPLGNPCPIPSIPAAVPNSSLQPTSPPAIAAMPNMFNSSPAASTSPRTTPQRSKSSLKASTVAEIVAGDIGGIGILVLVSLLVYNVKRKKKKRPIAGGTGMGEDWSTSSESKGIANWPCLRKQRGGDDDEETTSLEEGSFGGGVQKGMGASGKPQTAGVAAAGTLVTVDGGKELEVETLLRASAYILGASGSSIMYKAVLEDGTALAVRRVGEGGIEKLKDFETQVRGIAKLAHPNLVRVRGFYWGPDEKLVIYEFLPNGNLSNARYRKAGSSPYRMSWEVRLKIAKGVARGLSYLHEKKQVHGDLKPSNILLDADMEPKIGDFALERLMIMGGGCGSSLSLRHFGSMRSTASRDSFPPAELPAGGGLGGATPSPSPSGSSMGCVSPYQPPESLRSLKPNAKWDVYSYGVLFLELLTGKVDVVAPDHDLGHDVAAGLSVVDDKARILRMADVAIRADLEGKEDTLLACLKLGFSCASSAPQKRPSMKDVMQSIDKLHLSSSYL